MQVQEEIRAYILSPDRPDLPVEDFQRVIAQMYQLKIEKLQVSFEGEFLRGLMERYDDRVVIYVKKNMEEDWKRFISVKELCHVMNDEKEDWSTFGVRTIRSLLSEIKVHKDKIAPRTTQSEAFAEIAAIELLFPYKERCKEYEGSSTATLSNWYKIPEVIIARALSEEYHAFACEAWKLLD